MKYLLDTHALLWWMFDDPSLSITARGILMDRDNTAFVSSASAWEIATKHRLGKLNSAAPLVSDMGKWIAKAGFVELPVSIAHANRAGSWPQAHRDPFDRMLAAQSVIEDIPLITVDKALAQFGATSIW